MLVLQVDLGEDVLTSCRHMTSKPQTRIIFTEVESKLDMLES